MKSTEGLYGRCEDDKRGYTWVVSDGKLHICSCALSGVRAQFDFTLRRQVSLSELLFALLKDAGYKPSLLKLDPLLFIDHMAYWYSTNHLHKGFIIVETVPLFVVSRYVRVMFSKEDKQAELEDGNWGRGPIVNHLNLIWEYTDHKLTMRAEKAEENAENYGEFNKDNYRELSELADIMCKDVGECTELEKLSLTMWILEKAYKFGITDLSNMQAEAKSWKSKTHKD